MIITNAKGHRFEITPVHDFDDAGLCVPVPGRGYFCTLLASNVTAQFETLEAAKEAAMEWRG